MDQDYCIPYLDDTQSKELALYELHIRGEKFQVWDLKGSDTSKWVTQDMNQSAYGLADLMGLETIVDIGANVGIFSLYCARIFPEATIYAYEPFPVNYDNLVKNIELNQAKNVIPVKMAITGNGRKMAMACPGNNSGAASNFHGMNVTTPRIESVTLNTITELIPSVDLMKIDIEAMEYEVLWNFTEWHKVKNLSIELHGLFPYPKLLWQDAVQKFANELKTKPIRGKLWVNDLNSL